MIKKGAIILLRVYKKYFSPLWGNNYRCRFIPSCSEYAVGAIEQHGLFRGGILVFKRLLRCHPWSKRAGYDPVPPKAETVFFNKTKRKK